MNEQEKEVIKSLRQRGYSITIFNPDELDGLHPRDLSNDLAAHGGRLIDEHCKRMTSVKARREVEEKITRVLLTSMAAHGWDIQYLDDTEEAHRLTTVDEYVALAMDLDECTISFRKQFDGKGVTCFAQLVYGNDGWDCIADHSTFEDFQKVMDDVVTPFCETLEK